MKEKKDIEKLIKAKGLKKKYIANEMKIRPETLSRKLKNPETFSAEQLGKLSSILNVEIKEFELHVNFFEQELEFNSS